MFCRVVARVNQDGVVQHGSLPFGNGIEFGGHTRNEIDVELSNGISAILCRQRCVSGSVANGMDVVADANSRVNGIEAIRVNGDDTRESGDERGSRHIKMGLEMMGRES